MMPSARTAASSVARTAARSTKPTAPRSSPNPQKRPQSTAKNPSARRNPGATPKHTRPTWLWAAGAVIVVAVLVARAATGRPSRVSPGEPFVGGDLHSLVADPTTPGRVFIGGHEGVAVSVDNGRSFTPMHSLDSADAMGWAFNDDGIWQGGHPGLHHVGTDLSATGRNQGLPSTDVHALGGARTVLYAASPNVGFFASTDNGSTWQTRSGSVGQSFMGRILVDPTNTDHVVAPTMDAGAVESTDGGRTWKRLGGLPSVSWVSWAGGDPRQLVASGGSSAVASTDGGTTWLPVNLPTGAAIVEASPIDAKFWFAAGLNGTHARTWISRDRGATWQRS